MRSRHSFQRKGMHCVIPRFGLQAKRAPVLSTSKKPNLLKTFVENYRPDEACVQSVRILVPVLLVPREAIYTFPLSIYTSMSQTTGGKLSLHHISLYLVVLQHMFHVHILKSNHKSRSVSHKWLALVRRLVGCGAVGISSKRSQVPVTVLQAYLCNCSSMVSKLGTDQLHTFCLRKVIKNRMRKVQMVLHDLFSFQCKPLSDTDITENWLFQDLEEDHVFGARVFHIIRVRSRDEAHIAAV